MWTELERERGGSPGRSGCGWKERAGLQVEQFIGCRRVQNAQLTRFLRVGTGNHWVTLGHRLQFGFDKELKISVVIVV